MADLKKMIHWPRNLPQSKHKHQISLYSPSFFVVQNRPVYEYRRNYFYAICISVRMEIFSASSKVE